MNLQSLFSPVINLEFTPEIGGLKIYDFLHINKDEFPDLDKAELVIFSIEGDNSDYVENIRKEFYNLYAGYSKSKALDLGILKRGVNFHDTLTRIKSVCEYLHENNIASLILGDNHAYTLGQFYAFENLEKDISILNIDAIIDLKESEKESENHIKTMLLHQPNYIHNFTQLAYQSYLNPPEYQETIEQLSFDHVRLGKVVENIHDMEPYFRVADLVSFDINVVKSSDINGESIYPFGISSEQACQLAWYAGLSSACQSYGVYYHSGCNSQQSVKMIAVMLWYFIEGFYERETIFNFDSDAFRKYIVEPDQRQKLVFYKNRLRGQWWLEIPVDKEFKIIPCNYSDYLEAVEGDIPNIYLKGIAKYS